MIAFVSGRVAALAPDSAVVEVGGVGLTVQCTPGTLAGLRLTEPARLATALIVREDSLTLYGFADEDERVVFEILQTVSGVGPRVAQAMLAVYAPDDLRRAVAAEDITALTRVPGIGRKGAQRIVLELRDRLGATVGQNGAARPATAAGQWREQVASGLTGLGWGQRDVDDALGAVAPEAEETLAAGGEPNVAVLLKSALKSLSRR
ncbi:MAG: Holliday junction branch migration protein RuvA [Streptosporangiales bacterium]|nr:Holliday junction branch migration protein RuvA [Streptosporangiales bacterium]